MIIFGLCELRAAELHGNLTQNQRLDSVEQFRSGGVDFLICTDLAARGIDIKNVETVINMSLPRQLAQYVHRVGRTARAGRSGRSITLIDETQRKPLKEIMKQAKEVVKSRSVPHDIITKAKTVISELESDIEVIIKQEKYEKFLRLTAIEADAALNKLKHAEEIHSRPAKTWFQTPNEKKAAKTSGSRIVEPTATDREAEAAALKAASEYRASKEARKLLKAEEAKQKKAASKKDPLEGLSRAKKRRKLLAMEDAKEQAEEKAAAEAVGKKYITPQQRARLAIKSEKTGRNKTRADLDPEGAGNQSMSKAKRKAMGGGGSLKASAQPNRYDTGAMYDQANAQSGFYADSRYRDNANNRRRLDAQFKKMEDRATAAAEALQSGKQKGVKKGRHAFKSKARHKRR